MADQKLFTGLFAKKPKKQPKGVQEEEEEEHEVEEKGKKGKNNKRARADSDKAPASKRSRKEAPAKVEEESSSDDLDFDDADPDELEQGEEDDGEIRIMSFGDSDTKLGKKERSSLLASLRAMVDEDRGAAVAEDVDSSDVEREMKELMDELSEDEPEDDEEGHSLTVFVGGIPLNSRVKELRDHFKQCGRVRDIRIIGHKDPSKPTCVCFVDMQNESGVSKLLNLNGSKYNGKTLEIRRADDERRGGKPAETFGVFIRNLPLETDEEQLRAIFKGCGAIIAIRLPTHKDSGKRKGFGFIDFPSNSARKRALKLDRYRIGERQILVSKAGADDQKKF